MTHTSQSLTILYMYPHEMNIYGDIGNVLTLERRLAWRGITPNITYHQPGMPLNENADIIIGGGGQDSGQLKVCADLQQIGSQLKKLAEDGVPMLMICGMYQLFGHRFVTGDGQELPGIGVFDMETRASDQRLIGPLVINTEFGEVVGYENHSGQTYLADGQKPFGTVIRGYGNNDSKQAEGAITNNTYGCYLHGSLLPKNPKFADELLRVALTRKYGADAAQLLTRLDDSLADKARKIAISR